MSRIGGFIRSERLAASPRAAALVLLAGLVSAPVFPLDPSRPLAELGHDVWRSGEGIPQNSVNTLLQSREGYLWIGTFDGLVRFDGQKFREIELGGGTSRRSRRILALAEDSDGAIWIATEGTGLVRWTNGETKRFRISDGLPSETVLSLSAQPGGGVLAATDAGIAAVTKAGARTIAFEGLSNVFVTTVVTAARSGIVWAGTRTGLAKLDGGRFVFVDSLRGESISAIAELSKERLLVATIDGLFELGPSGLSRRFETEKRFEGISALLIDQEGALWISSRHGLARVVGETWAFVTPGESRLIPEPYSLLEDREGSLWVGTRAEGLHRLRDTAAKTFGKKDGLAHDVVETVLATRDGRLLVGTSCGGVDRGSADRFAPLVKDGLANACVWSLLEDSQGALWIGTWGFGLARIEAGSTSLFGEREGLRGDAVFALTEDAEKNLWIGTLAGLSKRSPDGTFTTIDAKAGFPGGEVHSLLIDRNGTLWVGTYGAGLLRRTASSFEPLAGLERTDIRSLYEDRDGTLWIGTFGTGLSRWKEGRLRSFTKRQGLLDDVVSGILEDDAGYLWLSSNRGLCRVSKSSLDDVASGRARTLEAFPFGTADGMASPECNGGGQPSAARSADGRLWFPTIRGLVAIDPKKVPATGASPNVVIESLSADGKELDKGTSISIAPSARRIEFQWAGLSLLAPDRVFYRYRLEGYDGEWIDAGSRRIAEYTHLPRGDYTFRVQASSPSGGWAPSEASIRFRREPSLVERPVAWVLFAISLGLALWGAHRMRLRSLERREAELERRVSERTRELEEEIATRVRLQSEMATAREDALAATRAKSQFLARMSHELRTPLNAILGFSSLLIEKFQAPGHEKNLRFLTHIETSGRHLLSLIDGVLDLSKIEAGRLEFHPELVDPKSALARVKALLEGITIPRRIEIEIDVPEILPPLVTDLARFQQIFWNVIGNAVRFSPDSAKIVVRVAAVTPEDSPLAKAGIVFDVIDQGCGIAPIDHEIIFEEFRQGGSGGSRPATGTGLGLALVRRFLEGQGGTIWVDSELGQGSTFHLFLPGAGMDGAEAGTREAGRS